MPYRLGVDLGTSTTAAAVRDETSVSMLSLGSESHAVPSVVAVTAGGVLVGEPANRRSRTEPGTVAREFKRRLGDDTPLLLSGEPVTPEWLTAQLLGHVLGCAADERGMEPSQVVLSHPAQWAAHRLDRLRDAARLAGLDDVTLVPEPEAAARHSAETGRLGAGSVAGIFDLGGGTFDSAIVRRTDDAHFELVGRSRGHDRLGGADLDELVFRYVMDVLDLKPLDLPPTPEVLASMAQLREDVVRAKETLSFDTSTVIPVLLPNHHAEVRLTRSEFEALARPLVAKAVDTLEETIERAGLGPGELDVVLLVGGSSRVPLVSQLVSERLGVATASDTNPKNAVAYGAASVGSAPTVIVPPASTPPVQDDGDGAGIDVRADIDVDAEIETAPPDPAAPPVSVIDPPTPPDRRRPGRLALLLTLSVVIAAATVVLLRPWEREPTPTRAGQTVGADAEPDPAPSGSTDAAASTMLPAEGFRVNDAVRPSNPIDPGSATVLADPGPGTLPQRLWQNRFEGSYKGTVGRDGLVVVETSGFVSDLWVNGIVGIDPSTGLERWRFDSPGFLHEFFVGDGSVVVVGNGPPNFDAEFEQEEILATLLDLETGVAARQLVVTPPTVDTLLDPLVGVHLSNDVLVTTWQSGPELVSSGFDLAGASQLWVERDPATGAESGLGFGTAIDDETFVVYGEGFLVARDLRSGSRLWSTQEVDLFAVRAFSRGVLVVTSVEGRSDYRALDARTGERRWSLASKPGTAYTSDGERLFVVERSSNDVYAVNLADGSLLWEVSLRLPSAQIAQIVRAGADQLYVVTTDGDVVALDTRNGELRWSTIVESSTSRFAISTSGEVLVVQTGEVVTAFG